MANAITSPTYDPITTATKLATDLVADQKAALTAQSTLASDTTTALNNLKAAISAFQSTMQAMSANKTVISQAATFNNTAYGSATAGPKAIPGTYSFFVEQIATAAQTSYGGLDKLDASKNTGTLKIQFGGVDKDALNIDLSTVGKNADGTLSLSGIATAINTSSNNNSRVTASIITVDGQQQLVLTSNLTGKENAASFDASGLADSPLKTALTNNAKPLVVAADAVVWLGGQGTGTKITQASNTFTNVPDVNITFTKAMAAGDAPLTMTVATDKSATSANVQAFVDAYNKLKGLMDSLADPGDPTKNVDPGIFAHDSGLNALRSSMSDALRQTLGNVSLVSYGITGQRDGSISLDTTKLATKLAADPTSLDGILGNSNLSGSSGVLGKINTVLGQWSNLTQGQITQRLAAADSQQKSITNSMNRLNDQYTNAYNRYLAQFSQLQILQEKMNQTSDMFDSMFSSDNS